VRHPEARVTTTTLTIDELSSELGKSRRTVERWLKDGRLERAGLLEIYRLGRDRAFDAASVELVRRVITRRRTGLRRIA